MVAGQLGVHDVGGTTPADIAADKNLQLMKDRPYALWEREVHAALVLCVKKGLISVDEMRRGVEQLEPDMYNNLSYYEKWAMSMTAVFIERKVFTRQELENALHGPLDEIHADIFKVGDKVVIKDEATHRHWRKPHLRIPGYVHGCVGEVVAIVGRFLDPSYAAFRDLEAIGANVIGRRATTTTTSDGQKKEVVEDVSGTYQVLYSVKINMDDVWKQIPNGDSKDQLQKQLGTDGVDELVVDVFHPWLQPAGRSQRQQAGGDNVTIVASPPSAPVEETHHKHHHEGEHHQHLPRCEVEKNAASKEGPEMPLQPLATAMISLLIAKDAFTRDDIRTVVESIDAKGKQLLGAKMVAKAWTDPQFKKELLADAAAAAKKYMNLETSNYSNDVSLHPDRPKPKGPELFAHGHTVLKVCENTPTTHNLVVCTLCSCYPASVLGLSPDWYKGRHYRSRAVKEPRQLLADSFGLVIPKHVRIRVFDSTAEVRYLVLPQRPEGTEGWSEEELVQLATRDSLIGVALPKSPNSVDRSQSKL